MKNIFRSTLIVTLIMLSASALRADLGWHLVYENDSSGNVVKGSVSALIAAIEAGADVKVIVTEPGDLRYRVAIPTLVTVGPSRTVVSANYRELSIDGRPDETCQIKSAAYDIDVFVNTTGFVSYYRVYRNGSKISDSTYSWNIKWFINN